MLTVGVAMLTVALGEMPKAPQPVKVGCGLIMKGSRLMLVVAELHRSAKEGYGMGMPSFAIPWTRELVLALPDDGNRYELLDGELLVTPAPRARHQDAALALLRRLDPYVRLHRIGHVGFAPADLALEG